MAEELNPASVAVSEQPLEIVASPTAPTSKLTEDEIFARVSQPAQEQPATTEETPSEAVAETQPTPEEPETELDLEAIPAEHDDLLKYKPLFKENPDLRGIIGRHAAFTEMFPDFQFARHLHETFPDHESAEQAVTDSQEWQRVSTILKERPEDFSAEYAEANPQGFARMAREVPKLLEQTDRSAWIQQRTETFQEILDNAASIASANQDQEAFTALQTVARSMGLRLGASQATPRTDPRDTELARLRKEKEDRQVNEHRANYESFVQTVESSYREQVKASISTDVKNALAKAGMAEEDTRYQATVKRMEEETWSKLDAKIKEQPDTKKRINDAFAAAAKDRRMGEADKRAIIDFAVRKAIQTKPAIFREVVNEWSKLVIGNQQKKIETRQTVAAQTKDPIAAAGSPPAAAPKANQQTTPLRPRRLSEDEILQKAQTGGYARV